jgi:hypothetical protein
MTHKILVIAWHLLSTGTLYDDSGAAAVHEDHRQAATPSRGYSTPTSCLELTFRGCRRQFGGRLAALRSVHPKEDRTVAGLVSRYDTTVWARAGDRPCYTRRYKHRRLGDCALRSIV